MILNIEAKLKSGATATYSNVKQGGYRDNNITLKVSIIESTLKCEFDCDGADNIEEISYLMTTDLRNYNTVIIPDGGRNYPKNIQTVDFWGSRILSSVSNICTPLYIFCGMDDFASLGFGIIGDEFERRFECIEPRVERALMASYRRLALKITSEFPRSLQKSSITEYVYLSDYYEQKLPWVSALGEYYAIKSKLMNIKYNENNKAMLPLWCSWTDWHSDDVTEDVIIDNVKSGLELGIYNYIIDDGWFGPGLDSDLSIKLNIGDWNVDKTKIKDLKLLVEQIHSLGANAIIWCAPHAVGEASETRYDYEKYLMKDFKGDFVTTNNKFNLLCMRNPQARKIMVDICVKLARQYNTDGAKYDLFNCIPPIECKNCDHEHDTESMIEALEKTLAEIWQAVRNQKIDYMVELKQNYGGAKLSQYGTMVRAGDTPYCPEGNFMRTAYIQGYMPYAMNDYQSIVNFDTPADNAKIIIKMLAVGVPTYSMDLVSLSEENKKVLKFLNGWYLENMLKEGVYKRTCQTADLNVWKGDAQGKSMYFILRSVVSLKVASNENFSILNGSYSESVFLEGTGVYYLSIYNCLGELISQFENDLADGFKIEQRMCVVEGVLI